MTPAARVQAAIEVLDLVIEAVRTNGPPADRVIADWMRPRRFIGSKDRRAVRDLAYRAIRACGPVPQSGRAAMLRLARLDPAVPPLFDGSRHGPAPAATGEPLAAGGVAPDWLQERLGASGIGPDEGRALLDRAPLDLRVNTLKASREHLELPVEAEPLLAPAGLRVAAGSPVEQWPAYEAGQIEVQDAGSQLACLAVAAQPGEAVIDLCAGAGGKTLALAAAMEDRGRLVAADSDRTRLSRLTPRADRAGVSIVETVLLDPGAELAALDAWHDRADAVLVDAPCSGTGTWRRNPEGRWRLTERQLARYVALQARLIEVAAELVRPGGRLVYVTCSLLDEEGADQIAHFLSSRGREWQVRPPAFAAGEARGAGVRLTPWRDGTDGFFVASLSRL